MVLSKLMKPEKTPPTALEEEIHATLVDLQAHDDVSDSFKMLYFCGAREFEIGHEKAIVIYVPVSQLRTYNQLNNRLVGELEKKLRGAQVFILAFRRIINKPKRNCRSNPKQKRPRNRTLTSVHENILKDVVYPAEIVGKRVQHKVDGSKLIKCQLDVSQRNYVEHKLKTICGLYKKLTGKDVVIEFPDWVL